MALFSRRPADAPTDTSPPVPGTMDDAPPTDAEEPTSAPDGTTPDGATPDGTVPDGAAPDAATPDDVPVVGISLSAFQGLGAQAPASAADAAAPDVAAAPSVPGLRDNAPLVAALAALPAQPSPLQLLHVARQILQGQLFLRVKGDAKQLLAEGQNIPLAITTIEDQQFVLAYSGVAGLRASLAADGARDTSAMAQPAQAVLRFALNGTYAGIILDPASAPARAVLSRELLAQLIDQADPDFTVKRLLAGPRTAQTPDEVVAALSSARLWIAVNQPEGSDRLGVAEARTADGDRLIEVFTHPIEIAALGRGDRPAPVTGAQLGAALRADPELAGILIDPAGPWIRLDRAQLAPLISES